MTRGCSHPRNHENAMFLGHIAEVKARWKHASTSNLNDLVGGRIG